MIFFKPEICIVDKWENSRKSWGKQITISNTDKTNKTWNAGTAKPPQSSSNPQYSSEVGHCRPSRVSLQAASTEKQSFRYESEDINLYLLL